MPGLAGPWRSFSAAGAVRASTGDPLTATAVGPCADSLVVARKGRPMVQPVSQSNGTASASLATHSAYHDRPDTVGDGARQR